MIFTPDAKYREYCTASIICDEKGNLYYANDSGRLFKLAGAESWRVAFDAQGGSYVAPRYVAKNKMVSEPTAPTRDGYTFLGWYTAEGEKWDFAKDVVTADMTLYAKWTKNESPTPLPTPSSRPNSNKGNATSVSLVLTTHSAVSLTGALKSNATQQAAEHESLLAGFDSGELEATDEESSERGAVAAVSETKKVALPIWPFIGMILGACVIVLVVLKRKKQGGE